MTADFARPPQTTVARLLRDPRLWLPPTVTVTVVMLLLALAYVGGIVNPQGHLRHLPVAVVDQDAGPGGARLLHGLASDPRTGSRLSLRSLTMEEAHHAMDRGELYGAIVIDQHFSAALSSLGPRPPGTVDEAERAKVTLMTNPRAGSMGVSLFTGTAQPALAQASLQLGSALAGQVAQAGESPTAAQRLLLGDPLAVTVAPYRPLGAHSGSGLTAFYYILLLTLCGNLGGNIIGSTIDAALGYAPAEIGPRLRHRAPVGISRLHTFLLKSAVSAAMAPVASAFLLFATAVLLKMDTPHATQLWLFGTCAITAVAIGTQALLAALGSLGQLAGVFIFVALALPSSGGTVPLQALPGFYRFLSSFEPARQLIDGARAILYFDARADAGLTRAWIMIAVGGVAALAAGALVARLYDRRGLHRLRPSAHSALREAFAEH